MNNPAIGEFIDKVKRGADITQVIGNYVQLRKKGNRYWGCCPFHSEKTPSFSVVPEDGGFFYCFGCHVGGDVFKFISLIENVSYFEAVKIEAEKLDIPLPKRNRTPAEIARDEQRERLYRVNELAKTFFHNCLTVTKMGQAGIKYLKGRGLAANAVEEFSLGFSPAAWDKLAKAFIKRGIDEEALITAGLCVRREKGGVYDRFRGRVMIPIDDERGRTVGFGGRILDNGEPKYLNTAETPIFNKRRLLFGLYNAKSHIRREGYVIVVEGYMDAVSLFEAGVKNVVATLGTAFTAEHIKLITRYTSKVYFCFDSDEAGQRATMRTMSVIRNSPIRAKVITVTDGKDPDEFIRKNGRDGFFKLIENATGIFEHALRYILNHAVYNTLEGKLTVLKEAAPILAAMADSTERREQIRLLGGRLMIDEDSITAEVRRHLGGAWRRYPEEEQRTKPQQQDSVSLRAERIILQSLMRDKTLADHVNAMLPEGLPGAAGRELFANLCADGEEGQELSEEAKILYSRIMNEPVPEDAAQAYTDAVNLLRKNYLEGLCNEHIKKAGEYYEAKDMAKYREELAQVKKINAEIKELA